MSEPEKPAAPTLKIKHLVPADPGWYAGIRGRGDFEGAHMQRIACWAIVTDPDGSERVRACYLPLADAEMGPYLAVHASDDEDVLGISEPGKVFDDYQFYQDRAAELAKAEEETDELDDAKRAAPEKLKALGGNAIAKMLLAKIVEARSTQGRAVGDFGLNSDFIELASLGLIYPHMSSSTERADWFPTSIGREVALLDREDGEG